MFHAIRKADSSSPSRDIIVGWVFNPTRQLARFSPPNMTFIVNWGANTLNNCHHHNNKNQHQVAVFNRQQLGVCTQTSTRQVNKIDGTKPSLLSLKRQYNCVKKDWETMEVKLFLFSDWSSTQLAHAISRYMPICHILVNRLWRGISRRLHVYDVLNETSKKANLVIKYSYVFIVSFEWEITNRLSLKIGELYKLVSQCQY